jgi:hypothetical protein
MLAVAAGVKPQNKTVLMKQVAKHSSHMHILNRRLSNVQSFSWHLLFQSLFSRKHKEGLWTNRAYELCRLLLEALPMATTYETTRRRQT